MGYRFQPESCGLCRALTLRPDNHGKICRSLEFSLGVLSGESPQLRSREAVAYIYLNSLSRVEPDLHIESVKYSPNFTTKFDNSTNIT